jgi:protein ImuA
MATGAVARETVFALRREIARIEGTLPERFDAPATAGACSADPIVVRRSGEPGDVALATGVMGLDRALGGGLPRSGLVEIHGAETRDAGAAAGFVLSWISLLLKETAGKAEPLLWVGTGETLRETGFPHAAGLGALFGIAPQALFFCAPRKLADALWVVEEAAGPAGFCAIILEIRGALPFALTATRRLHMRAQKAGRPLFLLRHAGRAEPTAAPFRMIVSPAPSALRRMLAGPLARPLAGSIGRPAFTVSVDKSRAARPGRFTLEWNADEHVFNERKDPEIRAKNSFPVVSSSGHGTHPAAKARAVLAFPPAPASAAGDQPAREQRPAHRRARRTG